MSQVTVAKALSSELGWRIIELLVVEDRTESEIRRSLDVRVPVVKLHLTRLLEAGIVVARERTLPSGRTVSIYSLTKTERSVGFPPRKYLELSEALINGIRKSIGEDGAKMLLRDIGLQIGEDVTHMLNSRVKAVEPGPESYAQHFVNGILEQMETRPRVVRVGRHEVIYEKRNCPFEDLAMKYPGLVCDILDEAVHESVDKKLGATKTVRLKCKGHGDSVCRYRVEWRAAAR